MVFVAMVTLDKVKQAWDTAHQHAYNNAHADGAYRQYENLPQVPFWLTYLGILATYVWQQGIMAQTVCRWFGHSIVEDTCDDERGWVYYGGHCKHCGQHFSDNRCSMFG